MVDPVSSSKGELSNGPEEYARRDLGATRYKCDDYLDGVSLEAYGAVGEESRRNSSRKPNAHVETQTRSTKSSASATNGVLGKPSSFAQLVRTWESYMTDGSQFQPLQVFQQLNLCGPEDGLARLTAPYTSHAQNYADLHQPYMLRHTHSTPSQHTTSILDLGDDDEPTPHGVEILNRSRSTPLSTSANSAFGTILKTAPCRHNSSDRSAFTLPLNRSTSSSSQGLTRQTTFNPIKHDKDLETELTSIEVMKLPDDPLKETKEKPESSARSSTPTLHNNASGRAARFFSDVSRNFRKKYVQRGGRDNPARPSSTSDDSTKKADEETISSRSTYSSSSKSPGNESCPTTTVSKKRYQTSQKAAELKRVVEPAHDTPYQQLDSDQDEDADPYARNIVSVETSTTLSSPAYHRMEDDQRATRRLTSVSIQIGPREPSLEPSLATNGLCTSSSPEPAQIVAECSTLPSPSNDSPGTSRCSATTNTSGHTTHATATTYSSEQLSNLSAISETDREVMEANKAGKLLNQGQGNVRATKGDILTKSIPLSSSRNVRYREYVALSDSPVNLREGANVPADRFFTFTDSIPQEKRGLSRMKTSLPSKKSVSHSPTTISSSSMTTNSSGSSADAPPTFVSYLDRKLTSDVSFVRESAESSSPRADDANSEKRESSPAEMLGYSDVLFEEAKAPLNRDCGTTSKKPRPIWPSKGLYFGRRVRSLPPRSPHKGTRTPTTPPPGSVSPAYSCLSPPRNLVDHRIDPTVSKPAVVIRAPVSSRLVVLQNHYSDTYLGSRQNGLNRVSWGAASPGGHEIVRIDTGYESARRYLSCVPRGPSPVGFRSRTYDEHNIEILKTDSKDDSSPALLVDNNL